MLRASTMSRIDFTSRQSFKKRLDRVCESQSSIFLAQAAQNAAGTAHIECADPAVRKLPLQRIMEKFEERRRVDQDFIHKLRSRAEGIQRDSSLAPAYCGRLRSFRPPTIAPIVAENQELVGLSERRCERHEVSC